MNAAEESPPCWLIAKVGFWPLPAATRAARAALRPGSSR